MAVMSNQRLVMVCGHVCCLKTSLSLAVAPRLGMNLLTTYGLGNFDPSSPERLQRDREKRYQLLFDLAEAYLSRGLSLWVDGNFPSRAWRSGILNPARLYSVPEIVVIQSTCSDPSKLEERFAKRREDPDQPDATARDIKEYFRSISHFEELESSEFQGLASWEVLSFDSCCGRIADRARPTRLGSEICRQMIHCKFLSPA